VALNRDAILATTRCPKCGAPPGEKCIGGGRRRQTVHPARVALAEDVTLWAAVTPAGTGPRLRRDQHMSGARRRWG
jgi:hypothetical protein